MHTDYHNGVLKQLRDQQVRFAPREKKLVIHIYRTVADYEAAEQAHTGGRFKRNLAFAHWNSRSAHVALQPTVSDAVLARHGLPLQTRNLVIHEASHILRYDRMSNYRSHPKWFGDGAAQFLKYKTLVALGWIEGLMQDPMSAKAFLRVQALLEKERLPTVDSLFRDQRGDLDFYELYAAKRLLFTWLATGKRRATLDTIRDELRRMGGGRDFVARMRDVVEASFGKRTYARLDKDWHAWIRKQRPAWDEIYRSLDASGSSWMQAAFPKTNAVCWRVTPTPPDATYTLRGRLEFLPGDGKQMNALLCRSEAGFISVAFTAGYGINVFDYRAKGNQWNTLAKMELEAIRRGDPIPIELHVDDQTLRIHVAGKQVIEVTIPGAQDVLGAWGLGAQRGSAGIWHEWALVR